MAEKRYEREIDELLGRLEAEGRKLSLEDTVALAATDELAGRGAA